MSIAQSVANLLDRFGSDVVLKRTVFNAYSPAADIRSSNEYSITVRCVPTTKTTARNGDNDARNVTTQSFFFGPDEPIAMGDRFTHSSAVYSVDSCTEISMSGNVVGYKVTAKR